MDTSTYGTIGVKEVVAQKAILNEHTNSTPANGELWYDAGFRFRQNNATINLDTINSHIADNDIHRNNNTTFVSIGANAGTNNNSLDISIGYYSGFRSGVLGNGNISIGNAAGGSRGNSTVFIGENSGSYDLVVNNSICIGGYSGYTETHDNCIILNASGVELNSVQANSFYVSPIRSLTNANVLMYNTTNKEITYNTLAHTALSGIGTNTHTQIDTFISANNINTILTTKGDILSRNTTDLTRLAVGTNGQVLTANSATATGLEWATGSSVGNLNDLTDVVITSAATRQILNHNGSNFVNTSTPTIDKLTFPSSNGARIIELLSNSGTYWDFLGNYVYDQISNPLFARWGCSLYSSQSYQISKGDPSNSANYLFTCSADGKGYFKSQLSIGTFNQDYALVIGSGTSGLINSGTNQLSTTSASWTVVSSKLIKRDITDRDTTTVLDDLLSVGVKDYKYISGEEVCTGIIAEDLLDTPMSCCVSQVPEITIKDCRTDESITHKNLNVFKQEKMFWRMLEGIQELIKDNRELRARILNLENIISNM